MSDEFWVEYQECLRHAETGKLLEERNGHEIFWDQSNDVDPFQTVGSLVSRDGRLLFDKRTSEEGKLDLRWVKPGTRLSSIAGDTRNVPAPELNAGFNPKKPLFYLVSNGRLEVWDFSKLERNLAVLETNTKQADSRGEGAVAEKPYDLFISYASEDREFAQLLVDKLAEQSIKVWFDRTVLKIGDSLRREIDAGLKHATFGVVILSRNYFRKKWPLYELDGLLSREMAADRIILPIWLGVTVDDVLQFSPSLADKVALPSPPMSVLEIAQLIAERFSTGRQ
ncbi:MAG: toll/interleukin-1 receptor domain-containing protein [Acidobacteriota bacterium]|nr:toll/interleukin-1 receptor domain-containing protein [Acidobacteriota bacterium]